MSANRAVAADWFIPGNKVTVRVTGAAIKDTVTLALAFHNLPFVTLRTNNADFFDDRLGVAAVRESRAGVEFAITPHFDHHWRATDIAVKAGRFILDLDFFNPGLGVRNLFFKWLIELVDDFDPIGLAGFDTVKFGFDIRRDLDIDDVREKFNDQTIDDFA